MMSSKLRGIKLTPPIRAIMFALFALGATAALAGTPKYGGIYFNEAVEVDGIAYPAGSTIYAETWPTQMVVKPIVPEGKTFMWYYRPTPRGTYMDTIVSSASVKMPNYLLPQMDGTILMTPPWDAGKVTTNKFYNATYVWYVDDDAVGGDETGDGSAEHPFETIQHAVDQYSSHRANTVILVKPGTYKKGGSVQGSHNCRVGIPGDCNIVIRSTDGASVTTIEGEPDNETYPDATGNRKGCGPNAYRCVGFAYNAGGCACIQGFTLKNGYTNIKDGSGAWTASDQGGGIVAQRSNYSISQHIAADCIITGCHAYMGASAYDVWLERCQIPDSLGFQYEGLYGCWLVSCVIGNAAGAGTFQLHCSAYTSMPGFTYNGTAGAQRLGAPYTYWGTISQSNGKDGTPKGYTWSTDFVADKANGDYRIRAGSKAQGGGLLPNAETETSDFLAWADVYAAMATGDVNGKRIQYENGVPWSGAVQDLAYKVTVSAENGALKVTSGGKVGDNALSVGETIVVAAAEDAVVHARGVIVNGEEVLFADCGGSYSYTVTGDTPTVTINPLYVGTQHVQVPAETGNKAAHYTVTGGYGTEGDNIVEEGKTITVEPNDSGARFAGGLVINGTNTVYFEDLPGGKWSYTVPMGGSDEPIVLTTVLSKIWYADANNGSDTNKGISARTAVKTLKKAMALATLGREHHTVRALPGIYNEGVTDRSGFDIPDGSTPLCRVQLKVGVTLESTDGPEKTIIMGAPAPGEDADEFGCGDGAVSCVRIQSASSADNAVCLRGFTLTGGCTRRGDDGKASRPFENEFYTGGAVHSLWGDGECEYTKIVNCIITNNHSYYATVHNGNLIGCVLDENTAPYGATASRTSRHYGCLLKSGSASASMHMENTTIGTNASFDCSGTASPKYYNCVNSLILGTVNWHNNSMTFTNCAFRTGNSSGYKKVDCIITNLEAIAVDIDDNYRIMSKDSVLVDATKDLYPVDPIVLSTRDALGGQRVYNGTVDIGAVEYDWRGDYAKDIAKREVVVSAADPQVIEREGKVTLDPGATLTAEWTPVGTSARCDVKASVTGTGTLTVSVDGAEIGTVTAADLPKTFNFAGAIGATSKILFAYSQVEGDEGCAVIEKVGSQKGFLLFVR